MYRPEDHPGCPKCGAWGSAVRYCGGCSDRSVEHLHRKCERCGFRWVESCRPGPRSPNWSVVP